MSSPERFRVLASGASSDERTARLEEGADDLAHGGASRFGNERVLLAVAAGLMTFGISLILLGWLGAAHSTVLEEQVPYLISGGLVGVALSIIGAVCLLAHWLTALLREERAREVARREDHLELMAALSALADRSQYPEDSANGRARSAPAQRPVRRASRRT